MAMIFAGDAGRRGGAEIGERDREQRAVDDAADQVAEKDPAPIGEHGLGVGFAFHPRQRQQAEAAGDQIEAEQHDQNETDRKDQRADQRLVGLHRAGDGETCRRGEDAAGKTAADDQIDRRQRKLAASGIDHRRGNVGRLHVIHVPAPKACSPPRRSTKAPIDGPIALSCCTAASRVPVVKLLIIFAISARRLGDCRSLRHAESKC